MNNELKCATCGYPLLPNARSGQCPQCLLRNALASDLPGMKTPVADSGEGSGLQDFDKAGAVPETPGRYTCITEYARGGMGRVLLVNDAHLNRDVALKELLPGVYGDAAATPTPMRTSAGLVSRFLQEARITGQLEHPSIVPVYELGQRDDGSIYYTMKLVRGRTLGKAIAQAGTLEERIKLLPHFVDLCQAIAYAHSRRVIHRDLKPANVMVGEFGETVVLDWGLAKIREREDAHASGIEETIRVLRLGDRDAVETAYGQALGTPSYMPPEQARGLLDSVDEHSDIYSLGAILYELITGSAPYTGKSAHDVLCKVLEDHPDPIKKRVPNAPPELIAICERAMQRDPSKRYASAKEIAEEIGRFQSGALVSAHRYSVADRVARFVHRHKAIVATATAAILLLLAATAFYFVDITRRNRELIMSRDNEVRARSRAEEEEAKAKQTVEELEHARYIQNIRLAQSNLAIKDFDAANRYLEMTPPERRNWEWGHFHRALHEEGSIFGEKDPDLKRVSFYPDRSKVMTLSSTKPARVWDIASGNLLFSCDDNTRGLDSVVFSADGKRFVATHTKSLEIFDGISGLHIRSIPMAKSENELTSRDTGGSSYSAGLSPDGQRVLSVYNDKQADVWDTQTGAHLFALGGHTSEISGFAFSLDGRYIATASYDLSVRIWDAQKGTLICAMPNACLGYTEIFFSADSQMIAVLTQYTGNPDYKPKLFSDEPIAFPKVYETRTGKLLFSLQENVFDADISSDWKYIAIVTWDKKILLFDLVDKSKNPRVLAGHGDYVTAVKFSPDAKKLATTSLDLTIKIWNIADCSEDTSIDWISDDFEFEADGSSLVADQGDGTLGKYSIFPKSQLPTYLDKSKDDSDILAISADGKFYLAQEEGGPAHIRDANSGKIIHTLNSQADLVRAGFSPKGTRLWTAQWEKDSVWRITVWDAVGGKSLFTFDTDYLDYTTFSPDDYYILAALRPFKSNLWGPDTLLDASTGEVTRKLNVPEDRCSNAFFSPDGSRLALLTYYPSSDDRPADGEFKIIEAKTGEEVVSLANPHGRNTIGGFSPDGKRIAISTENSTTKVWDASTGAELFTLPPYEAFLGYSPDGKYLLTANGSGHADFVSQAIFEDSFNANGAAATLWDGNTGAKVMTFGHNYAGIMVAAFSPDGSRVVTTSGGENVTLWETKTGDEIVTLTTGASLLWDTIAFSSDGTRIVARGYKAVGWGTGSMTHYFRTTEWVANPWN